MSNIQNPAHPAAAPVDHVVQGQDQPAASAAHVANHAEPAHLMPPAQAPLPSALPRLKSMLQASLKEGGGVLLLQRKNVDDWLNCSPKLLKSEQRKAYTQLLRASKDVTDALEVLDTFGTRAFMKETPDAEAVAAVNTVVDKLMALEKQVDALAMTLPQEHRLHVALAALRHSCAARISEVITLTSALRALSMDPHALEQSSFALAAADIVDKNMMQVMSELAQSMHGMEHNLEKLQESYGILEGHVIALEADKSTLSETQFSAVAATLKGDLTLLQTQIRQLEPSAELEALRKSLRAAQQRVEKTVTQRGQEALKHMVSTMYAPMKDADIVSAAPAEWAPVRKYDKKLQDLAAQMQKAILKADDGEAFIKQSDALIALREKFSKAMEQDFPTEARLAHCPGFESGRKAFGLLGNMYDAVASSLLDCPESTLQRELTELYTMYIQVHYENSQLHNDLLVCALTAPHVGIPTLMEAKLRGIPARYLETAVNDGMYTGKKVLGQGVCNQVFQCTFETAEGTTNKVFKPEIAGARNFSCMALSQRLAMPISSTRMAEFNIASQIAADAIGCGSVLSQCSIGTVDNTFGLFMEMAPGMKISDLSKNKTIINAWEALEKNGKLPHMLGELQRQLSMLEWADLLSGQQDRHGGNFMVDINANTGAVKVTGIDNDMSFPLRVLEPGTVQLTGSNIQKLALDASGTVPADQELHTVNLHELPISALLRVKEYTGINQGSIPNHIGADVYTKLMHIDVNAYKAELTACLRNPAAVEAAMQRLAAAQNLAQKLAAENKVLQGAQWGTPAMLKEAADTWKSFRLQNYANQQERKNATLLQGFFVDLIVPLCKPSDLERYIGSA